MTFIKSLLIAVLFLAPIARAESPGAADLAILQKPLSEKKMALQKITDAKLKFYVLAAMATDYASQSMTAATAKDAKSYAETLLEMAKGYEKDWNYGNAIHHGNLTLGRVALFDGNVEAAKKYLMLATKTSGSPQLHSFGPNMTLAKELLENGEKSAVLSYLDACLLFWKSPHAKEQVDSWRQSMAKGKTPDFGGNLGY
ncbi:MAG TPA: hypothetical protein VN132_04815 [Bdellovibrio sp.]|nr:hypothetical protein [Bdellovibrio sp.]